MHPRHRNDDRKSTRIGGAHWHGQITRQLQKTATRNSHNKQARAHTTSIFRLQRPNFPKTRHQRPTRRREEHPRHRNDDRTSTRVWSAHWHGHIARRLRKIGAETRNSHDKQARWHTRQAPSISNDQIPPKRFKRKTDRKRRRRQRRRRALGRPACAPARAAAARAARARAAAAADGRADARKGRRGRRVGDWHGARVAAAAPPPTDALGDDKDNDDEGRPANAHGEHVPLCVRRRPRRPCSRSRR